MELQDIQRLRLEASDPRTSPSRLGQLASLSAELALMVACHPGATPAMLRRLARRDELGLLAAICCHPSTPEAVVHALAARLPSVFAEGPWGRDFLADPARRPPRANHLRARLTWPGAPAVWFERASRHAMPRVRAAAALAPSPGEALLARLAGDPVHQVRAALARRAAPPTPCELALVRDARSEVRAALATRQGLPDDILIALARDAHDEVRSAAARQPAMPGPELLALARDPSWAVRWALTDNPNTPEEALELLASPPPDTRFFAWQVIHHPRSNEAVSASLLAHPDVDYRQSLVLAARVISPATWARLCSDPSPEVRHSLAFRGDVPDEAFELLAADASDLVRSGAALNRRLPAPLLERLARDPAPHTRSCAAQNPSATDALHEELARDADPRVRASVARWARSAAALQALGRDPDGGVRVAVFYNRSTPPELKRALARDSAILSYQSIP